METKKFTDGRTDRRTDGRTDAEGYNIIRPFFKRAYKNKKKQKKKNKGLKNLLFESTSTKERFCQRSTYCCG